MSCCDNLIHPFQHDPGVSQRQRVMEDLLSGTASIDGRTMADLLNYFSQLSRQVNFYDANLNVSDWQPFFRRSIPFSLAAMIGYNKETAKKKIDNYNRLFDKHPNPRSLQLIVHFIYYQTIQRLNQWHQQLKGSELPAEKVIEKLIKDKLNGLVKKFLCLVNTAAKKYHISRPDTSKLLENDTWNLPADEISSNTCFTSTASTKRKRLIALRDELFNLFPEFISSINIAGNAAELSMEQSLFPLKEEFQKNHPPHLALLFSFLRLFRHLQSDLNSYSKRHLDFFYQDVLQLTPRNAEPDKAHIVFEIQKQLDKYLLKKGLEVKDGKDNKKAEIYFSTDDEIVVNKTQVVDQRTLFLNNLPVKRAVPGKADCNEMTVVEGVYMAPDATKANGVDKEFKDVLPARATLGAKWSKYADPENKFLYPYPNARIGFILASPVLLLNEGTRKITITLACELNDDYCATQHPSVANTDPCCAGEKENNSGQQGLKKDCKDNKSPQNETASQLYNAIGEALCKNYYHINRALIATAVKKGIGKETLQKLEDLLTHTVTKNDSNSGICYCPQEEKEYETTLADDYTFKTCRYYYLNEITRYKGITYKCIVPHTVVVDFVPKQWKEIKPTQWDQSSGYEKGQYVFFEEKLFRSKVKIDKNPLEEKQSRNKLKIEEEHNSEEKPDQNKLKIEKDRPFNPLQWQELMLQTLACGRKYIPEVDFIDLDKKILTPNEPLFTVPKFENANWKEEIYDDWNASHTYEVGDYVIYKKKIYYSKEKHTSTKDFQFTKWVQSSYVKEGFEEIFLEAEREALKDIFKPHGPLDILFSGKKEWLSPLDNPIISFIPVTMGTPGEFTITITSTLKPEEEAITFYNAEALKEDFNTNLPLVKIELDDKVKIKVALNTCSDLKNDCCEKTLEGDSRDVSLYHFFRNVKLLEKTKIDVQVCGVKNLIVQNDENIESVNGPIRAFGSRPRVDANFYIGSKEIFSKNWQEIYVNAEWKDKPGDFGEHYKHYSYKTTIFEDKTEEIFNDSFLTSAAVLDRGGWEHNGKRRLFKSVTGEKTRTTGPYPLDPVPTTPEIPAAFCQHGVLPDNSDVYNYTFGMFPGLSAYKRRRDLLSPLNPYSVNTQYGFLRLTLNGVSFQHDIYPFVLTRHMMAYAGLLSFDTIQQLVQKAKDARKVIDAMIIKIGDVNTHAGHLQLDIGQLTGHINTISNHLGLLKIDLDAAVVSLPGSPNVALGLIQSAVNRYNNQISTALAGISVERGDIQAELNLIFAALANTGGTFDPNFAANFGLIRLGNELSIIIKFFEDKLKVDPELKDGLPAEPYTPVIKSLSLDYTATADVYDIDLIHLYPYAGTYKPEALPQEPMLVPTYCDEGNFFIGLKDLVPGSNINILFQLAEATADSEAAREELLWYYLENNNWKLLRDGFEVLDDDTNGLTTSGIIKFALPENMTNANTILPKDLHWIKAGIPGSSRAISEIIGIHTQAIKVVFTNQEENDKLRLDTALPAASVSKLKEADTNVKAVDQPYDSFGGRQPEVEGQYYVRASELLRHKGRAIQKWDYERIVLEAFPQIYRVKCINHSFALNANRYINDFPVAPGYVLVAVIPDLTKMKAANSFEPKAPVSLLEDMEEYIRKRTSPFVRLRLMNPRYEKINFCLKVKLYKGKDENYYRNKLKEDLREFLAPWAIGEYSKLSFGQCVNRSDIVRFMEGLDYMDYIIELKMKHAMDKTEMSVAGNQPEVCPLTPRSILLAGEIDVCIRQNDCDSWDETNPCSADAEKIIDYCDKTVVKK